MKNLLIVNKYQFGYHTDYYKFSQYLKSDFNITFICFDSGRKKLEMEGVSLKYVSSSGLKAIRGIRYLLNVLIFIRNFEGIVFVHHFEFCKLLKIIFPSKKMILDFRSQSINPNPRLRLKHNKKMHLDSNYFDFITVISEGVRDCLDIDKSKSTILPLGSDVISESSKIFDHLRLLYVGSLDGRNIENTISGIQLFLKDNPFVKISYEIIGEGACLEKLRDLIIDLKLEHIITLHGRIPHFELKPFFDNANVGVSYVPISNYYDIQPVTKTFEYIFSGIPCIATKTSENVKVINNLNGVLCLDSPSEFSNAISKIYSGFDFFDSSIIRNSLQNYTWDSIVKNRLLPVLLAF